MITKRWNRLLVLLAAALLVGSTGNFRAAEAHAAKHGKQRAVETRTTNAAETNTRFSGNISWYGMPFHGRKTASGRTFDMNKLTCAHRTLPFGTKVLIENPKNGNSVIVEVTDRGPFVYTRIFDVSRAAARELGTLTGGTAFVNCLVLDSNDDSTNKVSSASGQPTAATSARINLDNH